jgi:radical SAM superfamily enzyme YgiQ (UPF0313 family)
MVKPVVHLLRNYGFWVHGFFVSGIPGETDEHRNETIRFIKEVNLDWSGFSLLMPTRGSDLFKMCVKRGFINRKTGIGELEYNKYIINTPEYSADYVIKKTYLMNLEVNFVNNFRMKNGECQIAADAFLDVIKRYGDHAFAYYYLSKALGAMNRRKEAEAAMHTYHEIRENDDAWKEYANYFKLN